MGESNRFGVTYSSLYRAHSRGALEMAQGHTELARRYLEQVLQESFESHDLQALAYSCQILAELDLLGGHAADACAYLMPLLDQLHGVPVFADCIHPFVAWALLDLERNQEAAHVIEICIAGMRTRNRCLRLVDALRVRAMLAIQSRRWKAAKTDLDEAIMLAKAMPYPYAELKALWVYGQLEGARGNPAAARKRFMAALAICDRLGEGLYRPHIERDLAAVTQKG